MDGIESWRDPTHPRTQRISRTSSSRSDPAARHEGLLALLAALEAPACRRATAHLRGEHDSSSVGGGSGAKRVPSS